MSAPDISTILPLSGTTLSIDGVKWARRSPTSSPA